MGLGEVCVCVCDQQADFHKLVKEEKKEKKIAGCNILSLSVLSLGSWITKLSVLKSRSSILPSSSKKKNPKQTKKKWFFFLFVSQ